MLNRAYRGLDDMVGPDPERRLDGLAHVAIHGRSFTFVLQTLKSAVGGAEFNEWYLSKQEEMKDEPLFDFFRDLRNELEKEGVMRAAVHLSIRHLGPQELEAMKPPGAEGELFFGDEHGGYGFAVTHPDGRVEKVYYELPPQNIQTRIRTPDPPMTFQGAYFTDTAVEVLADVYLEYLLGLMSEAEERWGTNQPIGADE